MNAAIQNVNMAGQMLEIESILYKLNEEVKCRVDCPCGECVVFRLRFKDTFEEAIKAIKAQNDMIQELQQNNADEHFPKPHPITVDEDDIPF